MKAYNKAGSGTKENYIAIRVYINLCKRADKEEARKKLVFENRKKKYGKVFNFNRINFIKRAINSEKICDRLAAVKSV